MNLHLRQVKSRILNGLGDLLFPLHCVSCGREGSLLCYDCREKLPRVEPPYCQRCGTQIGQATRCPSCHGIPMAIDGIRSPFRFEGAVRRAIHQLKYQRLKAMAVPLGQLLSGYSLSSRLSPDYLAPVPLHPRRLRERGFNQASLLARELRRVKEVPVLEGCLFRARDTSPQARTAGREERRANMRGAFGCRRRLDGKSVLLVDDVCTTGATLDSCAAVLKDAGAISVWGLTVAREL